MFELSNLPRPIVRYGIGLWRRRWLIAIVAWICAFVGWFGVWLLPDQYESKAEVFVQTETILDPVMNGVTARPNYERRVEVMALQLLTRPNIQEVIYRANLDDVIKAKNPVERQAELEGLIEWVSNRVRITSPREMYFDISFRYGDPEVSRDVVDAVLNLLIEQDLGASLTESEDARRRLEQQIQLFDTSLTAKEREVAEFRQRNAAELAMVQGNARRREQVDTDLSRLADELSLAKRRVTTLETILSTTPRQTSGDELDDLLVELAALRSQYRDEHPDIRAVQARIDELSATSNNRLPSNPEYRRVENELSAARDAAASIEQRQTELRDEQEAMSFTIGQAPAVQAELQRIERDYEQTRKSYEELLQRRDRLSLTENLGAGGKGVEYQVYERPVAAIKPVAPPRMLLILAVMVAALGAGAGIASILTYLEKSFTQTIELQEAFGLPVLGALSESRSVANKMSFAHDAKRLVAAFGALALIGFAYLYWETLRLPANLPSNGPQTAGSVEEASLSDNLTGEGV